MGRNRLLKKFGIGIGTKIEFFRKAGIGIGSGTQYFRDTGIGIGIGIQNFVTPEPISESEFKFFETPVSKSEVPMPKIAGSSGFGIGIGTFGPSLNGIIRGGGGGGIGAKFSDKSRK